MPFLLIDTSTERGIVAIAQEEKILFFKELPFGFQNSQQLIPAIQLGLKENGLKSSDLDWVAVCVGPGSYTGIRVGATAAKALAFACHVPLVGICTLEGFVPNQNGAFAAVIDAKIGGAYIQKGIMMDGRASFTGKPQLYPLPQAVEILQEVGTIVTPNAGIIRQKLEDIAVGRIWSWLECYPSPLQLARVANQKVRCKEYSIDGHLDLLYLRKTQAEIEKESGST